MAAQAQITDLTASGIGLGIHRADNEVWLITGANRGIGLALAERVLSQPGATVIATMRIVDAARHAVEAIKRHPESAVIPIALALPSPPGAFSVKLASTLHAAGISRLDVVVANAGFTPLLRPALATPAEEVRACIETNTIGPLSLAQDTWSWLAAASTGTEVGEQAGVADPGVATAAAAKGNPPPSPLSSPPRFVVISSLLGSIGLGEAEQYGSAYGASKAAANFLVKRLHLEEPSVCSIAISPGWVNTNMGRVAAKSWGLSMDPPLTEAQSAEKLFSLISNATIAKDGGKFLDHDGATLPW